MERKQTISSRPYPASDASVVNDSVLRSMIALAVALTAVALIAFGSPYEAKARFVFVVFVLAVAAWTLIKVDETLVALAAVTALLAGGAIPVTAIPQTLANPVIGLLLGAFVLSAALSQSGLAERAVIATIGRTRSVAGLFHGLTLAIMATAFVIPSTTGRAALFVPVFLALAATIEDARIVRALALLIPSVVLLSACAVLTGAGAHLVATDFIVRTGGPTLDYARWSLLGLPFAAVSSLVATNVILWLFLARETRMAPPTLPRVSREPLDRSQRMIAKTVIVTLVALICATAVGIEPALVALAAAALLVIGPFSVLASAAVLKAIEWKLMVFLLATILMCDALMVSGAAHVIAADLISGFGREAPRNPVAVVATVSIVAPLAHLVVTSRTARAVVLIPVVALPLAEFGYNPTVVILLVVIGTGFCQTMPVSAKTVALYAALKAPTYAPKDLALLSVVLLPIHLVLLMIFSFVVWPLLGVPLKP